MDSKFGPSTTHEEIRRLEEKHNTQEDPTIMGIFLQMRQPPVLTPLPNLFPKLDICIPQDAGGDSPDEIVQSLSQLSLAVHSQYQQFSHVHATPNSSR